jgi:hypothetical protein
MNLPNRDQHRLERPIGGQADSPFAAQGIAARRRSTDQSLHIIKA